MLTLDKNILERLLIEAKGSTRLRAHHCLHSHHDDAVQHLLISMLKGTYIPPHSHDGSHQWEYFHIVKGEVDLIVFDKVGCVEEIYSLSSENLFAVRISPGTIHTVICRSDEAVVMEIKEGPFSALNAKKIVSWAPLEGTQGSKVVDMMESLSVGDTFLSFYRECNS